MKTFTVLFVVILAIAEYIEANPTGESLCQPGSYYSNGICVPSTPVICPPNTAFQSGKCLPCPIDTRLVDGVCLLTSEEITMAPELSCPPGTFRSNNKCIEMLDDICPSGTKLINGLCSSNNECPSNSFPLGGICVKCPENSSYYQGQCIMCPPNTIFDNGLCRCPPGQVNFRGTCFQNTVDNNTTLEPTIRSVNSTLQTKKPDNNDYFNSIDLTNIINNTDILNVNTTINDTNINNISADSNSESGSRQLSNENSESHEKIKDNEKAHIEEETIDKTPIIDESPDEITTIEECCIIIGPRICTKVEDGYSCVQRREHVCGQRCKTWNKAASPVASSLFYRNPPSINFPQFPYFPRPTVPVVPQFPKMPYYQTPSFQTPKFQMQQYYTPINSYGCNDPNNWANINCRHINGDLYGQMGYHGYGNTFFG